MTGLIFLLLNELTKPPIVIKPTPPTPTPTPDISPISPSPISLNLQARMSLGERILVTKNTTLDKEAGVKAFASGDFITAVKKFQSSLKKKNDPEALIYKNNAQIGKSKAFKIVISVPIGGNVDIAEEMLRGVAQAQDEVNRSNGINGQPLQILIANDDAVIEIAQDLAAEFVKDSSILAIIGHSRNEVSVQAAKIYKDKLVMVSTNNTVQLSQQLPEIGKYIFRIVPNQGVESDVLANYIVTTAQLKTITICADSTASITSDTTKKTYAESITNARGQVITNCDFGNLKIPDPTVVSQAISAGAEGLLLIPKLNKINRAFEVAEANKGNLALFGHPTLYTFRTLQQGKGNVRGMVLTAFWHPDAFPNNPFSENANRLWGRVNWQTAASYDALQAIITGLRKHDTREGLQQALSDPNFVASGATGTIKFKPDGDREGKSLLVKIEPKNPSKSGTGYDFVLLR
ncbi:ABC transporter substrate-binding protein [Nostoc sp. WHI]|uniref:ABC transporter substrate-binding protein n=1 Tax=Nostoc sp. WHI TaxID=2650611 RepID=UPI0018C779FB